LPALVLTRELKTVSPSAISLPPYIVYCAVNANDADFTSLIAALIENAMFLFS